MKKVNVVFGIESKNYSSFNEMVKECEKENYSLINGQVVRRYWFDRVNLIFEMESGYFIRIYPGENRINSEILSKKPSVNEYIFDDEINFKFSKGGGFFWRPKKVIDDIVNRKVAFFRSDQVIYFHIEGHSEKVIDIYLDRDRDLEKYLVLSEC